MKASREIDEIDRGILHALSKDPQTPNTRIGEVLGVSEITIASRIEALINDKVMKITVQRDMRTLGYEVFGLVEIWVEGGNARAIADQIGHIPQVFSLSILIGPPQIIVLLMSRDSSEFLALVEKSIGSISGVSKAATSIVLDIIDFKAGIAALS
jgi:DNA-binding Lrp family transcriptional regulator